MAKHPTGKPLGEIRPILVRALGLFRPFRWHLAGLLVLIGATSSLELLPWLVIGRIVDQAVPGSAGTGQVNRLFGLVIGIYAAAGLLRVVRGYLNQIVGQGVMVNLRHDLHAHLQRLSHRFYAEERTGEILSRVTNDVNAVQQTVTNTFTMFLVHTVTLGVATGLMFSLDWRLALLVALVLPLWTWPTIRVGDIQRKLQLQWRDESANMTSHLAETLSISGSMLVRTFGRQDHEAAKFARSNSKLRAISIRRFMAGRWFNTATSLFGSIAVGFVYWFGVRGVISGDVPSVGEVVAFAGLASRVFQPFQQIALIFTTSLASLALFERIFEYLDLPVEIREKPDALSIDGPRGAVAFEDVPFRYADHVDPALDRVSFKVEPGQRAAVVGPSGAGKTTITLLLQRFYDPQSGSVLLDGHDLRDLSVETVSDAVGCVMQETYLFNASLADNIRYGRLDAGDDEVLEAAVAAGMEEMVQELPDGFETMVGERGFRLSGGEKQRVAIARAILSDPPVLVLDEATASLDTRLEREIQAATDRLAEGRSTIVIAHRLSTVVDADVIYVLDAGRIVEQGRHADLLARGGLYATLFTAQQKGAQAQESGRDRQRA